MLGIELNPYATELASVSVWIGEIQWMRRNGFEAAKNPILRTPDTIQNRDAVLNPDRTRAKWPKADVVVGSPPFLGNKKMIREPGEGYSVVLRKAWGNVPGGADLVCYWFAKAWEQLQVEHLRQADEFRTRLEVAEGQAFSHLARPVGRHGQLKQGSSDNTPRSHIVGGSVWHRCEARRGPDRLPSPSLQSYGCRPNEGACPRCGSHGRGLRG